MFSLLLRCPSPRDPDAYLASENKLPSPKVTENHETPGSPLCDGFHASTSLFLPPIPEERALLRPRSPLPRRLLQPVASPRLLSRNRLRVNKIPFAQPSSLDATVTVSEDPMASWHPLLLLTVALAADFDASGCGRSKGCWLEPEDCGGAPFGCDNAVSFRADNDYVDFELFSSKIASSINYLSLGFSEDSEMGGEAVTHCSFLDKPEVHVTFNFGKSNAQPEEANEQKAEPEVVELVEAKRGNESLYCRFRQRIAPSMESPFFPRLNSSFVLLFARGKTRAPRALAPHSFDARSPDFPAVSPQKLNLVEDFEVLRSGETPKMSDAPFAESSLSGHTRRNLVVAHGVMMIIAWMICVAVAVFSARYLRHHWPQKTPFGVRIWFHIHRSLNVFAVVVMLLSLLLVFVAKDWTWKGPWFSRSADDNLGGGALHSLFGSVALILGVSQPFNSLLRCAPDARARPLFNWSHRLVGLFGFLAALIAILIAALKFSSLWTDAGWAVALVVFYGVCAGLLVAAAEWANAVERRQGGVVAMELKTTQQRRGEQVSVVTRGRGSQKHKHILAALFAITVGIAIAVATILVVLCVAS
ncbi:hypothetical protein QR680_009268 [Steinernema hermaphroditum]|uniref:Cytochrome b561 domain-containing protein n=1 Tax=Steinernema hermaphroditum TaxID=289476 RepID=A0AA39IM31_9BILA|nr:hypothetical protein QR680_009268 [Steinernema hermaphroditum]